jgi:hypothetical protein
MLAVGRETGADRGDRVAYNEDIGDRRVMDIAIVVVDLPAPYQQFSSDRHCSPIFQRVFRSS